MPDQMQSDLTRQATILAEFRSQCAEHRSRVTASIDDLTREVRQMHDELLRLTEQQKSRSVAVRVLGNMAVAIIGAVAGIVGALWGRHN